jgi:hypothetical protein
MTDTTVERKIEDLFRKVGKEHHHTYIKTNGEDPDWPLWYADYSIGRLKKLLNASFTRNELAYLMVMAEKEQVLMAPGADWAAYYARFFIQRYT